MRYVLHMNSPATKGDTMTLQLHTLSTGRTISAGIHCFSSAVNADGSEMARSEWTPLSDTEQSEAWQIVDARCRAHRAAQVA